MGYSCWARGELPSRFGPAPFGIQGVHDDDGTFSSAILLLLASHLRSGVRTIAVVMYASALCKETLV